MRSFGWLKDYPDFRDLTLGDSPIYGTAAKLMKAAKADACDLRPWCTPIEDQGELGSCTANAAVGLLEFYEKKSFGSFLDASRLFIYKTTRNLMKTRGDTGAYLRTTMKALAHFGVCPEEYLPYRITDFDREPEAFLYAYAQNFKGIEYYRLDTSDKSRKALLEDIRKNLVNGLPMIFGFTVYSSIETAEKGMIPFPDKREKVLGGHAITAVGYDDSKKIGKCQGALLIRNSWGRMWGEAGYGWLPYEYVLKGLAEDFWSLIRAEYIESALFD